MLLSSDTDNRRLSPFEGMLLWEKERREEDWFADVDNWLSVERRLLGDGWVYS